MERVYNGIGVQWSWCTMELWCSATRVQWNWGAMELVCSPMPALHAQCRASPATPEQLHKPNGPAGRWHHRPHKQGFGGIPCLSVGKELVLSMVSPWAGWDLTSLCCWSGNELNELKGTEDLLMETMRTCSIRVELCASMGEEGFSVFHVSKCNSLRSNTVHSHQHQTGARLLRLLGSAAGVGEQRFRLLGWKSF